MSVSPAEPPQADSDSIGSRLKAAGQLAAKQAQRTKLVTITLPGAYKGLGKHAYGAKAFREEFAEMYGEFDRLTSEMKAIKSGAVARPVAEGLVAKGKAAASAAVDMAQTKTLEMKVSHAFGKFGHAIYEKHREQSGPQGVVRPIAEIQAQVAVLDAEIARLTTSKPGQVLTVKRIALAGIAVSVVLFGAALKYYKDSARPVETRPVDYSVLARIAKSADRVPPSPSVQPIAADDRYIADVVRVMNEIDIGIPRGNKMNKDGLIQWFDRLEKFGLEIRRIPTRDVSSDLVSATLRLADAELGRAQSWRGVQAKGLSAGAGNSENANQEALAEALVLYALRADPTEPFRRQGQLQVDLSSAIAAMDAAEREHAIAGADFVRIARTRSASLDASFRSDEQGPR